MQTRWAVLAAAGLATVAAGLAWIAAQPGEADAPALGGPVTTARPASAAPPPALASTAAAPAPDPGQPAKQVPPTTPSVAQPMAKPTPDPRLAAPAIQLQRYSALAASSSAADQHAAYRMLGDCLEPRRMLLWAEQMRRMEVDPDIRTQLLQLADSKAFLCAHLPHADAHVRLGLLHKAIAGGVREAWSDWFTEGPGGHPMDLIHHPDDPRVQEWVRASTSAVAALARQGDADAAYLLASFYGMGPPAFADARKTALFEALGLALGQRSKAMSDTERAVRTQIVDNALQRLSVEQAAVVRREVAAILAGL